MNTQNLENLIDKYLNRKATADEVKVLNDWYYSYNDQEVIVNSETANEKEIIAKRLFQKIQLGINKTNNKPTAVKYLINASNKYKVAAAVMFVTVLGAILYFTLNKNNTSNYIQFAAVNNKVLNITLPDSSKVILNSGSILKYAKDFAQINRTVFLEGEAYFEVTPNASKPFSVIAGNMGTQVLGTSFNIKAYEHESVFNVTVLTGKVAVGFIENKKSIAPENIQLTQKIILQPNEKVALTNSTKIFEKVKIEKAQNDVEWQKGILVFDKTLMTDVASRLKSIYNVTVNFENENIKNCRLIGKYPFQTLETTLKWICSSTGTNFKKEGDVYLIYGEGCK